MLPPAPLLLVTLISKKKYTPIVADLHTGFFRDSRWRWFTGFGLKLLRGHSVIVTNRELARVAEAAGVEAWILDDILKDQTETDPAGAVGEHILCPLSYANDEPVDAILEAARRTPQQTYILTGEAPDAVRSAAPPNVQFSGYVSKQEYEKLLRTSLAVVALTDRDLTMQRAGYEALMAGLPQITSDFEVLRDFLGGAACFVQPDNPTQIADAVSTIANSSNSMRQVVRDTLQRRIAEQATEIVKIRKGFEGTMKYA